MARPSVAAQRREQIIEAAIRTIAEHGIAGASLDRIADTAGMSRGHVRHFAGNRDNLMLDIALALFADESGTPAVLPSSTATLEAALDFLFGEEFTLPNAENSVVLGLVELSRTEPDIAAVLTTAYGSTAEHLARLAKQEHPEAPEALCEAVAENVLTSALGNVFLGDFHEDPERTARLRRIAEALLSTLPGREA